MKSQIATVPGCQASPGPWFPEGSLPLLSWGTIRLRVCRDLSEKVHGEGRGQRRREVAGWVCGGQRLQGAAFGIASTQAWAAGGRASWEVGLSRDGWRGGAGGGAGRGRSKHCPNHPRCRWWGRISAASLPRDRAGSLVLARGTPYPEERVARWRPSGW